jgi:hypothetical protein
MKVYPCQTRTGDGRLQKILDRSIHDLTVFKLHFGKLTLKMSRARYWTWFSLIQR